MPSIELSAPVRLDGRPVSPQSLWLLLRLWVVASGADPHSPGWLRAADVREHFARARSNPRMLVSRAFADFGRWGIRVGWGTQLDRPLSMLSLAGRSRGPFWLAPGEAERIRIMLDGRAAAVADVLQWLDLPGPTPADATATGDGPDAAYWHAWAGAKADMQRGRLMVAGGEGALSGYRTAQALAGDAYGAALALVQQAMVWRRAGNADAARAVLAELDAQWHDVQAPEHAWLGAMAAIVSAWCAYADRSVLVARQILREASTDARWALLFQHHPRVRCEASNLLALIHRAEALDDTAAPAERQPSAAQAVAHYRQALALACESELFDAAASTASNLGWSLWLFRRSGLCPVPSRSERPLRWIALADALSRQHGLGGGSWNTIYLLRMVRDGGPPDAHPELAAFRRWPVTSPAQVAREVKPMQFAHRGDTWLAIAGTQLAEVDAGRIQVDALQRANLLLEVAWYEAHQGDLARAAQAAARLRRRLRELMPVDREFFRAALRRLPELGKA